MSFIITNVVLCLVFFLCLVDFLFIFSDHSVYSSRDVNEKVFFLKTFPSGWIKSSVLDFKTVLKESLGLKAPIHRDNIGHSWI